MIPEKGIPASDVLADLRQSTEHDLPWLERLGSGINYPTRADVLEVSREAYSIFFQTNALYPTTFPSLARLEREVVEMVGALLSLETAFGSVTSGGTESILLAVKGARDAALARDSARTSMIVPATAHPAFWKASEYFGVAIEVISVTPDGALDLAEYEQRVRQPRAFLAVGSAPSVVTGLVDPISDMASIAQDVGVAFHVDACVGGLFLPWVKRLGRRVEAFDFSVPGVTTISADLHKYGYTAKGASVLLTRDESIREAQAFSFGPPYRADRWYSTPTMAGSRPGGAIASAWAVLNYLGVNGYSDLAEIGLEMVDRIKSGIGGIERLRILGDPPMPVFAYTSDLLDIFEVASGLEQLGWLVKRDTFPRALIRAMWSPGHAPYLSDYLRDLQEVVGLVEAGRIKGTTASSAYT